MCVSSDYLGLVSRLSCYSDAKYKPLSPSLQSDVLIGLQSLPKGLVSSDTKLSITSLIEKASSWQGRDLRKISLVFERAMYLKKFLLEQGEECSDRLKINLDIAFSILSKASDQHSGFFIFKKIKDQMILVLSSTA